MTIEADTSNRLHESGLGTAEQLASIMDAVDAGVLVVDPHGDVLYCNDNAANWLPDGSNLASLFANVRMVVPFDGWLDEIRTIIDSGSSRQLAAAMVDPDQASKSLLTLRLSPFRPARKEPPTGVVILLLQGPEHDALEQQLEVSTRLTSLGKLASRVAHELNNPLDGILRYTNLAMRLVDDSSESKLGTYLAESRTGLMRMVQIIGDLLEFSRTTDGAFDAVSINDVIEQSIRSVADAADANGVVIAADFQTRDMPSVCGNRLFQVCCNLLKNAIDAMSDGGRLSITAGLVNGEVIIQVSDNGPGLPHPPEKVFEPFFTTKEPGKGTGLGLAICKDFIEEMSGSIRAVNGEDTGAVFTIRIPQSSCRPAPVLYQSPDEMNVTTEAPTGHQETVHKRDQHASN